MDWSKTSLGPVETWSHSLRTCIRIMLASRQPIWIGWGKELIKLYNDPYIQIVGGKHPNALGKPASVVWKDIWKDISPLLKKAMEDEEGSFLESQLLIMERNGYPEETYYTFSYTPIPGDDGATAGMICYNSDDTERIISGRQLVTLTQLGKGLIDCKSASEVYHKAMEVLSQNPHDIPFACVYNFDTSNSLVSLGACTAADTTGINIPSSLNATQHAELFDGMMKTVDDGQPQLITSIQKKLGQLPRGAWPVATDNAYVVPITESGTTEVYGFLLFGLNPYRLLDESYRGFLELVSDQVALYLAEVYAFDKEKKRAEALAELDRAKTLFFSNISHELRTPLTLMLSPIEEVLNMKQLPEEARNFLTVSLKNTKRLQKLVNNLLDFSRIEAGRMEAEYSPVDVGELTADLVSTFRAAVEKAGMQLEVDIEPIAQPVHLDADMWEKIVLNLVSNAFKYTLNGSIKVSVKQKDENLQLQVSDTGIGISKKEIGKVFDRFHRVANAEGRTQEGSGIGLSLVKELVKLHHGTITVESELGKGSMFTVLIPYTNDLANSANSANLIANDDRVKKYHHQVDVEVEDRDENDFVPVVDLPQRPDLPFVLIADDNADMREYLHRLLAAHHNVVVVRNGEEAYAAASHQHFDLIISDIMMPKLDGFGLLEKLKHDPATKNIPLIFLSARAGEEARIEGLQAGADDYLVKPFSARELIAKVDSNIRIALSRTYAERHLYSLLMQMPAAIAIYRGPEFVVELVNDSMLDLFGATRETVINNPIFGVFPEAGDHGVLESHRKVFETGERVIATERLYEYIKNGKPYRGYFNTVFQPLRDLTGNITGIIVTVNEVTDEALSRKKIEDNEKKLNSILMQAPVAMAIHRGRDLIVELVNDKALELAGRSRDEVLNHGLFELFPELRGHGYEAVYDHIFDTGQRFSGTENEVQFLRDGKWRKGWFNTVLEPLFEPNGTVSGILIVTIEVTDQVIARHLAEQSQRELNEMANAMPQLVWIAQGNGTVSYYNNRIGEYAGAIFADGKWKWEGILHPDDLEITEKAWSYALTHGTVYSVESRLQMADGSYRWHLSRANPQKDAEGKIIKWFGTATDIHDARKVSKQKDEFMSIVSHELKTPVTSIKAYTQLLEQKFLMAGDEQSSSLMHRMDNQINKLSALINDLLDITKLDEGKLVFKNEPFSCIDVVNEIVEELQRTTSTHNITKEIFTNCQLRGDRDRIGQVLTNLLSNAIKYSPQANEIVVKLEQRNHEVVFSVRDLGIGIQPEKQGRIFDRFYRVEGDTLDTFPGLGLGLYISAEIVGRQGGHIWFESEPKKGSVFYFSLPIYASK